MFLPCLFLILIIKSSSSTVQDLLLQEEFQNGFMITPRKFKRLEPEKNTNHLNLQRESSEPTEPLYLLWGVPNLNFQGIILPSLCRDYFISYYWDPYGCFQK